jgi:hypothetical protein
MKTRFAILVILASIFASCSDVKDELPSDITGLTKEIYFEQEGPIDSIGLVEHYELLLQKATEGNGPENELMLAYAQEQLDAAEDYLDECIIQSGANWGDVGTDGKGGKDRALGYQYTTIRYKSIDHNGNPAMLSTLVVWPYNNVFSNPDPDNVIIGCHVTIGSNAERPTNYNKSSIMSDVGMMACCAKSNGIGSDYENLVIIPDYQGYGATHGEVHPYLSQEITARQVLDGVRAGIAYYTSKAGKLEKNWRSLSTGYSQGGSVAMAVHKYIEENNLVSEFNFAGSVCGSGPYDPTATLKKYIQTNEVYMPVAAAMMMYSMCNTNPRLIGKYSPDDFMSEAFINSGVLTLIEEKTLNTDQMQEKLLEYSVGFNSDDKTALCMYRLTKKDGFQPYRKDTKEKYDWESGLIRTAYAKTSDILKPEVINYFKDNTLPEDEEKQSAMKALNEALNDNVLHTDWLPAHPIFLYHTNADEVVTIDNYNACIKKWTGSDMVKGIRYNGTTETHVSYGSYFFMMHEGQGIKAIFDGTTNKYGLDQVDNGLL